MDNKYYVKGDINYNRKQAHISEWNREGEHLMTAS